MKQNDYRIVKNYVFVFSENNYTSDETKYFIQLMQNINAYLKYCPTLLKRDLTEEYQTKKDFLSVWCNSAGISCSDKERKVENDFYEIPLEDLKIHNEFCIQYPYFLKYNLIPIPAEYIKEVDENLPNDYFYIDDANIHNNADILQMNSDVFRRYVKNVETTILNQNKEAVNVVDIKDTISPMLMIDYKTPSQYASMNLSVTEDRPYFFNPNIAKVFNSNVVTIPMFFEIFGVDKYALKDKMQKLKEKQIHLLMIGLGGTMSNFCYFMNEIAKEFKLEGIFDLITLYEDDKLELSNLFRIPLNYVEPIFYNSLNHFRYIEERIEEVNKVPLKAYMLFSCKNLYKNMQINIRKYHTKYNSKDSVSAYNFVIGSPDIETRIRLRNEGSKNFICPLHYNNDLVIFTNPNVVANELMQETYGSIHLSYFFLNMFKMTLEIIDLMLKDSLEENVKVLDYSSKADIENLKKNVAKSTNSYIIC